MPWRNPEFWGPWIGPILAAVLAVLRVLYDGQETRVVRIALEAAICGLLTLAASKAVSALALNQDWSIVAGGCIGLMGTEFIRYTARRLVRDYTGPERRKK